MGCVAAAVVCLVVVFSVLLLAAFSGECTSRQLLASTLFNCCVCLCVYLVCAQTVCHAEHTSAKHTVCTPPS